MGNRPSRHVPRRGSSIDPNRCVASVSSNDRWPGFYQCGNKRKGDTEWCGIHTYVEPGEDAERLYYVEESYAGDVELKSAAILKETKKQIKVERAGSGLSYKTTISKNAAGEPLSGARTPDKALVEFHRQALREVVNIEEKLKSAKERVDKAWTLIQDFKNGAE